MKHFDRFFRFFFFLFLFAFANECKHPSTNNKSSIVKIANGIEVEEHELEQAQAVVMVSVNQNCQPDEYIVSLCGATRISKNYSISAGHCFSKKKNSELTKVFIAPISKKILNMVPHRELDTCRTLNFDELKNISHEVTLDNIYFDKLPDPADYRLTGADFALIKSDPNINTKILAPSKIDKKSYNQTFKVISLGTSDCFIDDEATNSAVYAPEKGKTYTLSKAILKLKEVEAKQIFLDATFIAKHNSLLCGGDSGTGIIDLKGEKIYGVVSSVNSKPNSENEYEQYISTFNNEGACDFFFHAPEDFLLEFSILNNCKSN